VKGQLLGDTQPVVVNTACACCGEPIEIETDGRSQARAAGGAAPVIVVRLVDPLFRGWKAPSIIDGF